MVRERDDRQEDLSRLVSDEYEVGGFRALVDRLHFKPNLEVGIGDDVVATTINMEFVYKFPSRSRWLLYAGGGPAINFYSYDDDGGGGDTNTEGGLNLLFGVENRGGLFFEVKVGAIDSPDVKFGVGFLLMSKCGYVSVVGSLFTSSESSKTRRRR